MVTASSGLPLVVQRYEWAVSDHAVSHILSIAYMQEEVSTTCNEVYSHIAEREAVYEELPCSSGQDAAIGHTKASSEVLPLNDKCIRAGGV